MSYPVPQYTGTAGVVSAQFRSVQHAPELPMKAGAVSYLATGATTRGRFGLYRWDFTGPASGPAPHFHRSISESFFILTGTVRLHDGDRWFDAGPGDLLHVAEGGVHGFRNESGEPASMLLLFALAGIVGYAGRFCSVPWCVTLMRCIPPCCGVHGHIADGNRCQGAVWVAA